MWLSRSASGEKRQTVAGPFIHDGGRAWLARNVPSRGDGTSAPFESRLCLYENDLRLTSGHQAHSSIRLGGGGRYSHWRNTLRFSTSDGSNPNTNGRVYSFDLSLDLDGWERDRIKRSIDRWQLHPNGTFFMKRGGNMMPPPLTANLGLTNKCNLRCEICGSQKHLDITGVRRRHMDFATFEAVAETLFPVLSQVELNSQGDPLLYPGIEDVLATIGRHRCEVKIQHNGTLLTDRIIDLLFQQHGTLMLSLDAVGNKFDEVRQGGVWSKAEHGLTRLLRERNPRQLSVGVYPTWTTRTIGEAINVVNWCAEHGVDRVGFHRFSSVRNSWEKAPTEEEYQKTCDELRRWCVFRGEPLRIYFEGERLNSREPEDRRTAFADLDKAMALIELSHLTFPVDRDITGADPFMTCAAPNEYVEISLDGQVSACCRSQDVSLGYATSVESFCEVWFGTNYDNIRGSLRRGETGPYPLPNCLSCVKFFTPNEANGRRAVDYSHRVSDEASRLQFDDKDVLTIEVIQKEDGLCHIVTFPLGVCADGFELWEDDRLLGPGGCFHDDIRRNGAGRYHIGTTSLYFSTSDKTDARRNGRLYSLRRKPRASVEI